MELDGKALLLAMVTTSVLFVVIRTFEPSILTGSTISNLFTWLFPHFVFYSAFKKYFDVKRRRELLNYYRRSLNRVAELEKSLSMSQLDSFKELEAAKVALELAQGHLLKNGIPMADWKAD